MNVSILRSFDSVRIESAKLRSILHDMPVTAPSRYALAELALIRTAAIFESSIAEIAYKLACGGRFLNGNDDAPQHRCRSLVHARSMMRSDAGIRNPPKDFLKWNRSKLIRESVVPVLREQSHLVLTCQRFGAEIKEIFEVRHFAAHKNSSSRLKYLEWVERQYGQPRNIQLGYFLLTRNLKPVNNIERYISTVEVIVGEICNG